MGYYMGDYMAGDPGLFTVLGSAFARTGSALRRALPQLPAAAGMAGGISGAIQKVRGAISPVARSVVGAAAKHPVLSAAAAAGAAGTVGAMMAPHMRAPAMGARAVGQRGFHISRRTGRAVRNRRMRVTNVKALRRSIRRCQGFARLAKKVLSFTSPRGHKGRPYFKRRSKKRV